MMLTQAASKLHLDTDVKLCLPLSEVSSREVFVPNASLDDLQVKHPSAPTQQAASARCCSSSPPSPFPSSTFLRCLLHPRGFATSLFMERLGSWLDDSGHSLDWRTKSPLAPEKASRKLFPKYRGTLQRTSLRI